MNEGQTPPCGQPSPERLASVVARLMQVMRAEDEALSVMLPGKLEPLLEEKRAAARDYQMLIRELAEQPQAFADVAPARKLELREAAERLAAAAEANARTLRAGIDANRQLMEAIAAAVRDGTPAESRYLADGRTMPRSAAGTAIAVSVNRVL